MYHSSRQKGLGYYNTLADGYIQAKEDLAIGAYINYCINFFIVTMIIIYNSCSDDNYYAYVYVATASIVSIAI